MAQQQTGRRRTPLTIIIIYVLVSGAWILFSDRLLAYFVKDYEAFTRLQTVKGWFFVIVTAVLLYLMIQRYTLTLQQTQEQLREREAWYRHLITTAEEGIWVIDARNRISFVNQRLAQMLGYSIDEMLQRPVFDFIDPACHEYLVEHLQSRQQSAHEVYEIRLRCKDGTDRWVISSATPVIDAQGEVNGAFAMLTDITERHQAEAFQREFARKTIEAATEGKLLICSRAEIVQLDGHPILVQEITGPEDLEGVRHAVAEATQAAGMDEDRIFDFILCISEATTNAVKHAGGGTFSLNSVNETLLAMIADHGSGISAINLPEVALTPGYTTAVSLGMGYKTLITLADKIYLATDQEGTTLAIAMAPHAPKKPAVAIPASLVKF